MKQPKESSKGVTTLADAVSATLDLRKKCFNRQKFGSPTVTMMVNLEEGTTAKIPTNMGAQMVREV